MLTQNKNAMINQIQTTKNTTTQEFKFGTSTEENNTSKVFMVSDL